MSWLADKPVIHNHVAPQQQEPCLTNACPQRRYNGV